MLWLEKAHLLRPWHEQDNVGRAASRGAFALQPPRATCNQPEPEQIRAQKHYFRKNFRLSLLFS